MEIPNGSFDEMLQDHLGAVPFECRWCFAIDRKRVGGEIISDHNFPDLSVTHLRCPRCGGEFTYVSEGFERSYLLKRICTLYPQLASLIKRGLKFERESTPEDKHKSLPTGTYLIKEIKRIDGTEEARVANCLFPELTNGNPEQHTILELWFPGLSMSSPQQ
jgi:hypothetical protein